MLNIKLERCAKRTGLLISILGSFETGVVGAPVGLGDPGVGRRESHERQQDLSVGRRLANRLGAEDHRCTA